MSDREIPKPQGEKRSGVPAHGCPGSLRCQDGHQRKIPVTKGNSLERLGRALTDKLEKTLMECVVQGIIETQVKHQFKTRGGKWAESIKQLASVFSYESVKETSCGSAVLSGLLIFTLIALFDGFGL